MQLARTWPAVVLVQPTDETRDAPVSEITRALAGTLVADYGDDVLVIEVCDGSGEPVWDKTGPVHHLAIQVPDAPRAANRAIVRTLNDSAPAYAYSFLDLGSRSLGFTNQLVGVLGRANLARALHRRLVRLRRSAPTRGDADTMAAYAGWEVLSTVILEPRRRSGHKRDLLRSIVERMSGQPTVDTRSGPATEGHPDWRVGRQHPEEVRIPLSWDSEVSGSLSRWARAVSHRRVGLALGGSGAWGYAHAALITSMEDAGVPIDLMTSASSGSVIAAYYSVLGREGIDRVLRRGWRLDLAVVMCFATMASLELCIALDTGFVPLRQLEVMFFPVTSNLSTMRAERVVNASVPWAVRASSTAPGVWGSTTTADSIYVDGACTDNVPARLVTWLGGTLVVATNPLPMPVDFRPRTTHIGPIAIKRDRGLRFRTQEFVNGFSAMLHGVGDWEAHNYILYDPPPAAFPLGRTFFFNQGRKVYAEVLRQPELHETMDQVQGAWTVLSAARTGV